MRGYAGKGQARAAGPALLAIAAAALCLAGPTVASAAQQPAGTALAWGYNGYGELGDGSRTQISYTPVAVDLPAGTQVAAVAAGDFHSLAVTSDGGVLAWGANNDGQLGDGSSTTFSTTPVAVDLPAATRVTAVAAGFNQSLALTSDGSVLAWGLNNDGQLGDGSTTDSSTPVAVDLPAGTRVTAIAAGGYDSLALTSNGSVLAWGDGQDGALGADDGGALESSTPVAVDLPAGTRVTAIAAGDGYSLALTSDGSVLAWGSDGNGNLGDGGSTPLWFAPTPVPVDLPAGTRVTAIAAGGAGLALTSDGSVLAWGDNFYEELGDGSTNYAISYTPVAVDLPVGTRVTAIAAGAEHSLALTSDGSVLAWGDNERGELGDGSSTTFKSPTPVPVDLPAGTRVTAIAAGYTDSLALAVPKPVGPIVSGYRANKCVADSGDSAVNDTPITIATCDGSPSQNWAVTSSGTLQVNGKCLDIYRDEKTNKASVELWTCTGGANQQWHPAAGALVNPVSGKCLDDPRFNTTPDTQLELYTCNGGANQQWKLP